MGKIVNKPDEVVVYIDLPELANLPTVVEVGNYLTLPVLGSAVMCFVKRKAPHLKNVEFDMVRAIPGGLVLHKKGKPGL
jgi:hypothetical protein